MPPLLSRVWWLFFNALNDTLTTLSNALDALPAATYITNVTFTADGSVASPGSPQDGNLWIARVCQDAVGGWTVTWGTNVLLGPLINPTFNGDPSTMCLITFVGIAGKWYVCGTPILGVPTV